VSVASKRDGVTGPTTDGEIAILNLESARRRSWSRFFADPTRDGIAETVIEHEQLTLQFVGDALALDRVGWLADQLDQADPASGRASLIRAQVASMGHRFAQAIHYVSQAEIIGAPAAEVDRLRLTIDQARGTDLDNVLDARARFAAERQEPDDFVALGSLLADLCDFTGANHAYKRALQTYRDVSPFPVARVCFQLGMLWGELVHEPERVHAAGWYQKALDVVPAYVKARVHLAEIYLRDGRLCDAEALLRPVVAIGDPEVNWRLADVLSAQGRLVEAEAQMEAARSGFESLLERHLLAFADHAAEFYAGSGNDCHRALHLARVNVANRPTRRALELAYDIANDLGNAAVASELFAMIGEGSRRAVDAAMPMNQHERATV
jgi:tetratricopeptide (TPR) repeat protein